MPLYQDDFSGVLDPLEQLCLRSCGDVCGLFHIADSLKGSRGIQAPLSEFGDKDPRYK
jgi:hypothetical protein